MKVKIEPRSDPAGGVNCTCVPLLMNDQVPAGTAVEGPSNRMPCGVFQVWRQLKVTVDGFVVAAAYVSVTVATPLTSPGPFETSRPSRMNSWRVGPVIGDPFRFVATGKSTPMAFTSPWRLSG